MVVGTSATTNGGEGVRAALESVVTSNVRMHLAAWREKNKWYKTVTVNMVTVTVTLVLHFHTYQIIPRRSPCNLKFMRTTVVFERYLFGEKTCSKNIFDNDLFLKYAWIVSAFVLTKYCIAVYN